MKQWYERRDESLRRLRHPDYATYLASPRWKGIRAKVLNRCKGVCEVCGTAPATQVHHRSYCLDAMRGKRLDFLVACCRPCHEQAEFDAGRKTAPKEANKRMARAAREVGRVLYGICHACRKNPTARRKTVCALCARGGLQPVSPPEPSCVPAEEVLVTAAFLQAASSGPAAWTKVQLAILGVPWPPPKGWKSRLLLRGGTMTREDANRFLALRRADGGATVRHGDTP